jgi:preprotein translocase subunit SecY
MSLLIFTSIIATFPAQMWSIARSRGLLLFGLVLVIGIAIVAGIVFVEQAQRRIPVQYAKRMVGRRQYGGTSTYLPLKVNMAGVIPVIFASSLLYLPILLVQLVTPPQGSGELPPGWAQWISSSFQDGNDPIYVLAYAGLIMFFTYFYVAITFNPVDVADDMKKYGGFIPGIRAGRPTAEYLDYVISRITFPGSIYLALIAVVPLVAFQSFGVGANFIFGGTSILIIVSVGLDTVKQIESQLQQRNYEGFLR